MNFQTIISNGLKDNLKCSICENYLSHFPISICSNAQYVCGRCTIPDGLTFFRDTAYETLAQFLKFPCRYSIEGCFEEVLPSKMKEHEENCLFREVGCIVEKPSKCEWKGSLAHLFEHCKNGHSTVILDEGEFEVSVDSSQEYDNLVEVEDSFFIFRRKYDVKSRVLEFTMFSNKHDLNTCGHEFKLKAQNGGKSISMNFQSCTYKQRALGYFDLNYVAPETHEKVKIKISKKKTSNCKVLNDENNSELLENLKCSKCSKFIVPPVYQCMKNSHIYYCSNCTSGASKVFKEIPILEKVASFVNYPCENYQNGCLFNAVYPEIKTHQINCKYRKCKCPFHFFIATICNWEGLQKDLDEHVLEDPTKHYVKEITTDSIISFKKEPIRRGRIISSCGRLFFFTYGMKDSNYVWSLGKISECNDRFRYEIIIDDENEGHRLLIGKPCCNNFEDFKVDFTKTAANNDYECIINDSLISSTLKLKEESELLECRLRIFKC